MTYLLLTLAYQSYLSQFDTKKFEVDGFTQIVSEQTKDLLLFFKCDAKISPNLTQPSINIYYNQRFMARIVEGCNALSIIILFIAFIISFSGKPKPTILFIIGGSLLIHVLNVTRIALLCILLYYYPEQRDFLHSVVFPLFIYGIVFILWVIWVNKFSKYATKTVSK